MKEQFLGLAFRFLTVLGSALVLQFYSEFYFLNEGPAIAMAAGFGALPALLTFTFTYALFAWLFLIVLDHFEVRDIAGLILAGAIFGWATEALVVPVVYEGPPISFFFPSVGWHALVDVVVGWYLIRLAMRRLPLWALGLLFVLAGMIWGLWASWTWSAEDEAPLVFTTEQFRSIVLISSASWALGTLLADIGQTRRFRASRVEVGLVGLTTLVLFVTMGLPFWPWMLLLAALAALTLAALRRARGRHGVAQFQTFQTMPGVPAYFLMALLPGTALLTYPVVLERQLVLPANDIVLLLMIGGAAAYIWAIWHAFRAH